MPGNGIIKQAVFQYLAAADIMYLTHCCQSIAKGLALGDILLQTTLPKPDKCVFHKLCINIAKRIIAQSTRNSKPTRLRHYNSIVPAAGQILTIRLINHRISPCNTIKIKKEYACIAAMLYGCQLQLQGQHIHACRIAIIRPGETLAIYGIHRQTGKCMLCLPGGMLHRQTIPRTGNNSKPKAENNNDNTPFQHDHFFKIRQREVLLCASDQSDSDLTLPQEADGNG